MCDWRYRNKRNEIDSRIKKQLALDFKEETTEVIENTIHQLNQYFNNERKEFDIPLLLLGTDFQKSVWNELQRIPFGETNSYFQLSRKIGNEKAIRAVASANGANAISILIPCHRIIGKNGSMVGYAGGLQAKTKLLDLEGAITHNQMKLF